MSNRATLNGTTFKDCDGETKGYRIYDDYGNAYDSNLESVPTGLDLLSLAMESEDEVTIAIIDSILENKKGISIDGTYYDWDEIKHLWGMTEDEANEVVEDNIGEEY